MEEGSSNNNKNSNYIGIIMNEDNHHHPNRRHHNHEPSNSRLLATKKGLLHPIQVQDHMGYTSLHLRRKKDRWGIIFSDNKEDDDRS
jgi:hypothetical protein